MKFPAWGVHIQWGGCVIKTGKLQSKPGGMAGQDSRLGTGFEKSLNSLMPKALNHALIVTRKLTAYKQKYAPCNQELNLGSLSDYPRAPVLHYS